jgi:hypothetical protein
MPDGQFAYTLAMATPAKPMPAIIRTMQPTLAAAIPRAPG